MQLGHSEVLVRVCKIGVLVCLLFFLDKKDRNNYLSGYVDLFEQWFVDVQPWRESDLAKRNRY